MSAKTIDTRQFLSIIKAGQAPNPDAFYESEALKRQAQLYYQGWLQMKSAVEMVKWMDEFKHEAKPETKRIESEGSNE